MDRIIIKNLHANGIIGIYEHERVTPQEMLINVRLLTDTSKAGKSDNIQDCLDYEKIANQLKAHAEQVKRLTVEALAEDLAALCLDHAGVAGVTVRVEKTQAIPFTESVGVEIERKKS